MCDITLINQYANTYEYEEDCNHDEGVLHLVEGSDNGTETTFTMSGTDTDSGQIIGTIDVPNSEKISPSKLFKYIAKTVKGLLCPSCL